MYILALSLDWFTTIPGILVSLGVVLLIVALVLFILGSKKTKKEVKVESNADLVKPVDEAVVANQEVTPVEDVNVSTVETQTEVSDEPKFEDIEVGVPGVDPINPEVVPVSTDELPKIEEPVKEEIKIEMPEVSNLDKTMVSVYGGENPVDNVSIQPEVVEEPKVTIYGGNDPLEATQNLPKVEEHHEPYGGAISEVKIVEPVEENVIQIPEVEPIQIETPTVEEPISIEIPATPVEIPSEVVEIPSDPVSIPTVVPEVTVDIPVKEEKPVVEEL